MTIGAVNLTVPTTFTLESDLYPDDYGETEPLSTFTIQERRKKVVSPFYLRIRSLQRKFSFYYSKKLVKNFNSL